MSRKSLIGRVNVKCTDWPTRDLDADQQATGRTRPVEAVTKQSDRDDGADVRISDGTGT